MLIGEAPGKEEIKENVPFIGRSGQLLMEQLQQVGLSRETVYITSAVRSRPFSVKTKQIAKTGERVTKFPNRTPTKEEIKIFAPLLDWEIAVCQPELILTLGNIGLQRLCDQSQQSLQCTERSFSRPFKHLMSNHKTIIGRRKPIKSFHSSIQRLSFIIIV